MYFEQFFVGGLGCMSYLVGCLDSKAAAVIDPDRDVRKYIQAARTHNLKITHIIETHLHADHVSGNADLAARTGAPIYVHEASGAQFDHLSLKSGDVLCMGDVSIEVLHTPGHTPESITLLVRDITKGSGYQAALTGDTLLVGDAGRPDLVGPDTARSLARDLYESLFITLGPLPDALTICPGHGPGSLCGRSIGTARHSTLGLERRRNPALAPRDPTTFINFATCDLPEQPGNHERIKAMNRRGPFVLGEVIPCPLTVRQADQYWQQGAVFLDARPRVDYLRKHIPGSASLVADEQLSNRAGFVLPPNTPLVLLIDNERLYEHVVYGLARVGFHNVVGYLRGGLDTWKGAGLPTVGGDVCDISPMELQALLLSGGCRSVIDVCEAWEFAQGHIPGARLISLGQLAEQIDSFDPAEPLAVICAGGNRSQSAAALLSLKRFQRVYNVLGGLTAWIEAGLSVEPYRESAFENRRHSEG